MKKHDARKPIRPEGVTFNGRGFVAYSHLAMSTEDKLVTIDSCGNAPYAFRAYPESVDMMAYGTSPQEASDKLEALLKGLADRVAKALGPST